MTRINKKIIFILGGARSGKSSYAQQLAAKMSDKVLFIATAEPLDDEMKDRIKKHKESRPENWQTLEVTCNLNEGLTEKATNAEVVIIDCLTLLVANLIGNESDYKRREQLAITEMNNLIKYVQSQKSSFIIVSNEVGLGVVPDNKLARDYRDILGKVNQLIARISDEVYFMVAGIPMKIK